MFRLLFLLIKDSLPTFLILIDYLIRISIEIWSKFTNLTGYHNNLKCSSNLFSNLINLILKIQFNITVYFSKAINKQLVPKLGQLIQNGNSILKVLVKKLSSFTETPFAVETPTKFKTAGYLFLANSNRRSFYRKW